MIQLKQTVWVPCYPVSQNQIGFGAITKIFDTEEGQAFEFYDEIEKPTGRMMGQYARAKNELDQVFKDKKK
jgi:hypothetical protein